ncbi:MAG: hypothetical protein F6J87_13930 [Spirulina sp. SIO3F2]|nr:hypothetical protein [Spirulina sp. SIO3F2]
MLAHNPSPEHLRLIINRLEARLDKLQRQLGESEYKEEQQDARISAIEQEVNDRQIQTDWNTSQIQGLMYLEGRNQELEERCSYWEPND